MASIDVAATTPRITVDGLHAVWRELTATADGVGAIDRTVTAADEAQVMVERGRTDLRPGLPHGQ